MRSNNKGKKKVLYISDSLGLSIEHHRGISNYSLALVGMLRRMGLDITLLVERVDGFGLCDEAPELEGKFSKIINSAEISEVYRYFQEHIFNFSWDLRPLAFRFPAGGRKHVSRSLYERIDRRPVFLQNAEDIQDLYPKRGSHLKHFDSFLWMDYVYSDASAFCRNDIAPIEVDASNFDYVVVDAPHYVVCKGIDKSQVFSVVHDVIPVTDPNWSWDWRTMFVKKIEAGAIHSSNYIFVSDFTKSEFTKVFPEFSQRARSEIIYPTLKEDTIETSNRSKEKGTSGYISGISLNKSDEKTRNIIERFKRKNLVTSSSSEDFIAESKKFGNWDGKLPYVCTILADEERKNIPAIIEVSKKFSGRLNFVIMGNISGNKYFHSEPEMYENVHFTGFVSEYQKTDLLNNALGFVFPSISEGFGIPIVEAGLYNTPVICSDIKIFREIAADKAIYFNPYSVDSFAEALEKVISHTDRYAQAAQSLRPSLIERFSEVRMAQRVKDYVETAKVSG